MDHRSASSRSGCVICEAGGPYLLPARPRAPTTRPAPCRRPRPDDVSPPSGSPWPSSRRAAETWASGGRTGARSSVRWIRRARWPGRLDLPSVGRVRPGPEAARLAPADRGPTSAADSADPPDPVDPRPAWRCPSPPALPPLETGGWFVESFSALLRLDTEPIEALEQRVIVAIADGLAELTTSISVPRHPTDCRSGARARIGVAPRRIARGTRSALRELFQERHRPAAAAEGGRTSRICPAAPHSAWPAHGHALCVRSLSPGVITSSFACALIRGVCRDRSGCCPGRRRLLFTNARPQ